MKENKSLYYQAIEAEASFRKARAYWLLQRKAFPQDIGPPPQLSIGGRLDPIRQEYLERQIDAEFHRR